MQDDVESSKNPPSVCLINAVDHEFHCTRLHTPRQRSVSALLPKYWPYSANTRRLHFRHHCPLHPYKSLHPSNPQAGSVNKSINQPSQNLHASSALSLKLPPSTHQTHKASRGEEITHQHQSASPSAAPIAPYSDTAPAAASAADCPRDRR